MSDPDGFSIKRGVFALFLIATLFGVAYAGKLTAENFSTIPSAQVAAVSDSAWQNLWCDIRYFFWSPCIEETPVTIVPSQEPIKIEVTTTTSNGQATTTIIQNVVNEYTTNPIERETVREVIVRDNVVDVSRFITRDEYNRQVDALLTSIENIDTGSSGGNGGIDDINGESIEDLEDVAAMSKSVGDLFTWTGSSWTNIATSSLGIVGGGAVDSVNSQTGVVVLDTGDISESGNLYFTNDRADARIEAGTTTIQNMISENVTGIDYASGVFSITSGYNIPLTASTTEWATARANMIALTASSSAWDEAYGWGDHATEGYLENGDNATFGNATTTNLVILNAVTIALADGCVEVAGGVLTSTGSNCGVGGGGIANLNGLTASSQSFATSTSGGLALNITSSGGVHTFTLAPASGYNIPLTASTTQWATAYSWGNHSLVGYLTSETDPIFTASDAFDITSGDITAWDAAAASTTALTPAYIRNLFSNSATGLTYNSSTGATSLTGGYVIPLSASTSDWTMAYNWGDHATEGYLTGTGTSTFDGNLIPAIHDTYDIGSETMWWRDLWIGPGSIYMNGKKILEDVSDTITFSTDVNQNLAIQTSGIGTIHVSATSTGSVTLGSDSGNINISSVSGNLNLGTTGSGNLNLGTVESGVWQGTDIDISDYTNLTVSASGLELSNDALALTSGYVIPLSASTTEWASNNDSILALTASSTLWDTFYTTPSNRITAGTGLAWSGNMLGPASGYSIPLTASTTEWANKVSSQWTTSGSNIYYNTGNVGIGTAAPGSKLEVDGDIGIGRIAGGYTFRETVGGSERAGIHSNLSNDLVFNVGLASEAVRILNSNGNVGIGTTTPTYKLHVNGGGSTAAWFDHTGSNTNAVIVGDSGSLANNTGIYLRTTGTGSITTGASGNFSILDGSDTNLYIQGSTGNVGIGTTSPLSNLHIYKASSGVTALNANFDDIIIEGSDYAASMILTNTTGIGLYGFTDADSAIRGAVKYEHTDDKLKFTTAGSDRLTVDGSGNVGIGTSTPAFKLDVTGSTGNGIRYSDGTVSMVYGAQSSNTGFLGTTNNYPLGLYTNGTQKVTVSASGNVGIGTSGPASLLHVSKASGDSVVYITNNGATGSDHAQLWFARDHDGTPNWAGIGQHGDGSLRLTGASSLLTPGMTIDDNNNVGIGTTTPGANLHISGTIPELQLTDSDNLGATGRIYQSGASLYLSADANSAYPGSEAMRLLVGGDEAVRIDSTGNVGIGTTAPRGNLDVVGADAVATAGATANGGFIIGGSGSGVINSMGISTTGTPHAWIQPRFATSATYYNLVLNPNGGNVGIGTTTPIQKLSVAGTVGFRGLTGAVGAGSLCLSSSYEVVYNSGSDNCLSSTRDTKHAITPLALDAIGIMNELQSVSFIYNGTERVRYGFIAEDTASVDDILATYNAEGDITGIDDRSILSVLVRAFQDFYSAVMSRFESQDDRIEELEERVRELESREGIDEPEEEEEENNDGGGAPVDLCENMADIQEEIPSGYSIDPDSGDCVEEEPVTEEIPLPPTPVEGCTDPEALNFNADATEDDGSCDYKDPEPAEEIIIDPEV